MIEAGRNGRVERGFGRRGVRAKRSSTLSSLLNGHSKSNIDIQICGLSRKYTML